MKTNHLIIRSLCLFALLLNLYSPWTSAYAQSTAITYQGQLNDANGPVNGTYDMVFNLYLVTSNASNSFMPLATNWVATTTNLMVTVSSGLFTTLVDFGPGAWNGFNATNYFQMETGVRPTGATMDFAILSPRQTVTPSPGSQYAMQANGLPGFMPYFPANPPTFAQGVPNLCGGYAGNIAGIIIAGGQPNQTLGYGVTVAGGGEAGAPNVATNNFATISGGAGNTVTGDFGVVAGGEKNLASGSHAFVGGGYNNSALCAYDVVVGGISNTVSGDPSFIGAGENNTILGAGGQGYFFNNPYDSYIVAGKNNTVNANFSGIGSGVGNRILSTAYSTNNAATNLVFADSIVGGCSNLIATNVLVSFIGGGTNNQIYGFNNGASGSTNNQPAIGDVIGGGQNNIITNASYATLGGGQGNWIYTNYATIPGGLQATATNYGQMAYASGKFTSSMGGSATTAPGNAQSSLYVLRNVTTNTTASYLYLDGSSAEINLLTNRACTFSVKLVGIDPNHYACGYAVRGMAVGTGSVFLTETPSVVGNMPIMPTAPSITVSGNLLHIQAHGVPTGSDVIRWVATVETAEVAW